MKSVHMNLYKHLKKKHWKTQLAYGIRLLFIASFDRKIDKNFIVKAIELNY